MQSDVEIKLKRFQKVQHDLKILSPGKLNCSPEASPYQLPILIINTDMRLDEEEIKDGSPAMIEDYI